MTTELTTADAVHRELTENAWETTRATEAGRALNPWDGLPVTEQAELTAFARAVSVAVVRTGEVDRIQVGTRGLAKYGAAPIRTDDGDVISLATSSNAMGTYLWLRTTEETDDDHPRTAVELNVNDATELRDRLNAWIADVKAAGE